MEEFPDSDEESDAEPGTADAGADSDADSDDADDAATQARLALRTVSEQFDDAQLRSALAASAATATVAAAATAAAVIYGNYTVPAGHTAGQRYQLTLRGTTVSVTGDEWARCILFRACTYSVFFRGMRNNMCVI